MESNSTQRKEAAGREANGSTQQGSSSPFPQKADPLAFYGNHRLAAAVAHLHNQINIAKEELEELETVGESSLVCKELVESVECIPDPLLPESKGPVDASWDRWFRGAHDYSSRTRTHKRWL